MADPLRLVEGEAGAEREILDAWRTRQPSDAARVRTLAAVGVGGVAGGAAAKAGASVAPKAIVASASLLKWLAIGVGLVVGTVVYIARGSSAVPSTVQPPVAQVAVSPRVVPPVEPPANGAVSDGPLASSAASPTAMPTVAPQPTSAPAVAPPPVAAPPASVASIGGGVASSPAAAPAVVSPKSVASAATPTSSLDEEVLAIDAARRAVASGDAATALERVDAYDGRYPNGALAQESAEIRIEALFRLGKRAPAERLAERFLAAHPTSPYARVIQGLLAGAPPPSR